MTIEHDQGFVDSDGLQIYYARFGRPPDDRAPLLLVHGWGAESQSNWLDTGWIDALAPHRSLITIDTRGHGRSAKPLALEPYSYAAMSRDVLAVLDALKIKRCEFMGYSMGSFMGAWLLGHHPERFTAMVLGGIGDETNESAAQGAVIAQALRATEVADITNPVGLAVRHFVAQNPTSDFAALAFSAEKIWPEGFPLQVAGPNIDQAQLPVLVVNGEEDRPYVDTADHFVAALPNGQHARIPGVDHMSAVADERFKTRVVDFLLSLHNRSEG